jgi:serine/threonine-protein kinase
MTERSQSGASQSGAYQKSGAPDPLIGRTINDRFRITALIARGGMGKVYRAEQTPLGRLCAIKILNPNYTGDHDPEFHKRFFLEASVASKLTHPNTVTIFDYGKTEDDIYYMAMELLDGTTLHRAIREQGAFAEERVAHVGRQICRALREAHQHDVIHRDLKPANIFLVQHGDEQDFVKVLDFGLVKNVSEKGEDPLTQTGLFMGSPKYMAPEQIKGDKVDARTDIYSLGIILYEMLTGKVPFDRANSVNILMAHVNDEVPPFRAMNPDVTVSPGMEETVLRCLAKDVNVRFSSMDEVLRSLKQIAPSNTGTVSVDFRYHPDASASVPIVRTGALAQVSAQPGSDPNNPGPPGAVSSAPWPSQPPPPLPAAPVPRSHGGALAIAILGIGVLSAVGVFAVMRGRALEHSKTVTSNAVASASAEAPLGATAAPKPSPAPEPLLAKVRVTSDPDGASVKEDGVELCNATPCDLLYKGPDAEPTKEHKLAFVRSGFRPETRTFKIGDGPVAVKMARIPSAPAPVPHPAPAPKPDTNDTPKGFKDIPY